MYYYFSKSSTIFINSRTFLLGIINGIEIYNITNNCYYIDREVIIISKYVIYTDGGCRNTGNVKGDHVKKNNLSAYAYLITKNGQKIITNTEGYYGQTNNQMEVLGVIKALLEIIKLSNKPLIKINDHAYNLDEIDFNSDKFVIVSDSKYVDNSINKGWLSQWNRHNYKKRKNAVEWSILYSLLSMFSHITFKWTKGHSDGKSRNSRGNIFVDHLLNKTMDKMIKKNNTEKQIGNDIKRINTKLFKHIGTNPVDLGGHDNE